MSEFSQVLKNFSINFFISVAAAAVISPIVIGFLYKWNQVSVHKKTKLGSMTGTNSLFLKIMNVSKTNGTPNMGGILILITVPLVTLLLVPITPIYKVLLLAFVVTGVWGAADVVFTNAIKNNDRLRTLQETFGWRIGKLVATILINLLVFILLYKVGEQHNIEITKRIIISLSPVVIIFLSGMGQFAIYASELTDGLDGLLMGIMAIAYSVLTLVLLSQGKYEFVPFIGIVLGCIAVDLYFNIPPARFWNGGPGAMPLGFSIFFISLVTGNLIPYFFITSVTWVIMLSSMLQIISMRLFKKRIFKIAPLHHHFQAVGWPDYKVTMRFWLYSFISGILGLLLSVIV